MMKWGLVIAGAGEMIRPVDKVSATQELSLFATGAIWTRWACIIKPKNYLLASVNFFLAAVASAQLVRISRWRRSLGDSNKQILDYIFDLKSKEAKTQTEPKIAEITNPAPTN